MSMIKNILDIYLLIHICTKPASHDIRLVNRLELTPGVFTCCHFDRYTPFYFWWMKSTECNAVCARFTEAASTSCFRFFSLLLRVQTLIVFTSSLFRDEFTGTLTRFCHRYLSEKKKEVVFIFLDLFSHNIVIKQNDNDILLIRQNES